MIRPGRHSASATSMTTPSPVTVVIPTIGSSPVFERCLEALSSSRNATAHIVVVADSQTDSTTIPRQLCNRLVIAPAHSGFAVSCNLGLAECVTPYAAIVNDDAVVEPDWLSILVAELEKDPQAAAAQGMNLRMNDPGEIDGCGIAWNRRWQPIQLDHGFHRPSATQIREIFGVSATAAVYRFEALTQAAVKTQKIFDPELHTYYDDVDLASRLQATRRRSIFVPQAKAYHAGGTSTADALEWRHRQLYGNRLLVLARLLGRSFWIRLPIILRPDMGDLYHATARRDGVRVRGILRGWRRAATHLRRFAHAGLPLVSIDELRHFRQDPERKPQDS